MANYVVPYAPQGQPFTPNFRLVELLREQGSDAADAALRHGAIDAQLANTLGNIPGQMIVAQRAGQESQLRDQAMQANAIDLTQKQKDADDRATMSRIWQAAYGMAPSQQPGFVGPTQPGMPEAGDLPPGFETTAGGVKIPSTAFLSKALASAGLGEHIPAMLQSNAKTAEAFATLAETKGKVAIQTANALGAVASQALDAIEHGADPVVAFHFAALTAKINDSVTNDQLTPYLDLAARQPDQIPFMLHGLVKASAEQQKLGSEAMTARARLITAQTGEYSDAGITKQLTEARLKASGAPVAPLPGALPSAGGPPSSLNADTGQPVIPADDITGGSVNPIAPSLSPASAAMLATAPIGTPEAPAPPAAPVLSGAEISLAEHQRVKEAGMRMAPDATITIKTMVNGKPVERVLTKAQALAIGEFPSQPPAAMVVNNAAAAAAASAPPITALRPTGPSANVRDPRTGMTPNGIYQAALANALQNTMPPLGLGQSLQAQAARQDVTSIAGALAAAAGTDLPTLRAEYKANAGTLSRLLPQATATANAANTATDNLDLALAKSADVPRSGSKLVNHYAQWTQGNFTPAPGLAELETYVYTAAREYAKVTSGGAASSQGLTDSAAREASKLLNAAQAGETFAAVVQAMKNDMANVVLEQSKGLARVSSTIGNFFSVVNGGGAVPTTAPATTPRPARRNPFDPPTGR